MSQEISSTLETYRETRPSLHVDTPNLGALDQAVWGRQEGSQKFGRRWAPPPYDGGHV